MARCASGDVYQLPSVGPGQVLADIIACGLVPVVRLTEVFRPVAGSWVITNAHRIKELSEIGRGPSDTPTRGAAAAARDGLIECQATHTQFASRLRQRIVHRSRTA